MRKSCRTNLICFPPRQTSEIMKLVTWAGAVHSCGSFFIIKNRVWEGFMAEVKVIKE